MHFFSPHIRDDVLIAHFSLFGPKTLARLRSVQITATQLLTIDQRGLLDVGIRQEVARRFIEWRARASWDNLLEKLFVHKISAVRDDEEHYPRALRNLHAIPRILFYRGTLQTKNPLVAVVGSREPTSYGTYTAERIGRDLATYGVGIVSGMARGIDEAVARAAIQHRGYTVGILACGFLSKDSRRSQVLQALTLDAGGAIVSEFSPDVTALKHHFPLRNRIIAGMSQATVVVEAAERSGSLITARLATELGRDVFAIPGPITSTQSFGTNDLLRQGAHVCMDVQDILFSLQRIHPHIRKISTAQKHDHPILQHLLHGEMAVDVLAYKTKIPVQELRAMLMQLELEERIIYVHGNVRIP